MNPLEQYGQKAADYIGKEMLDLPAVNRPQFLYEVLENISPGLYARAIYNAQYLQGHGLSAPDAIHEAIAMGIPQAFAMQMVSNGTSPIALGGLLSVIGDIVSFPVDVVKTVVLSAGGAVGGLATGVVSLASKTVAGILTKATCPIIQTKVGQVGTVAVATGVASVYGTPAAGAAAGTLAAKAVPAAASACGGGSKPAPTPLLVPAAAPAAPPPSNAATTLKKYLWPALGIGGGLLILTAVMRSGKTSVPAHLPAKEK